MARSSTRGRIMPCSALGVLVGVLLAVSAYAAPPPPHLYAAELDGGALGGTVPRSFMGMSYEWPYVEELASIPGYAEYLKLLQSFGSGPLVLRIGGGSTDKQVEVPKPVVWQALTQLHRATGVKYIIGLNLYNNDAALSRAQMAAAEAGLPDAAILAFEIGNEPDYYTNKPSTHWNGTKLASVSGNAYLECCFHTEWGAMAKAIDCDAAGQRCNNRQFAGPAWGHVNVRPSTIDWFLKENGRYVSLTTVHWYKTTMEQATTAEALLEEGPVREKEAANLATLVKVARSYGKPLRVAEMNSISNSGRAGVSDVMAAALWTLDAALEVAAAGGVGVNFHQGAGQNLYAALIRWYSPGTNAPQPPQVRPAFYGMLLFQMAVRGGSTLLSGPKAARSAGADAYVKVWPVRDDATRELRWVVINKDGARAASVDLKARGGSGARYASGASVLRLLAPGPSPLTAKTGITLAGASYGASARPAAERAEALGVTRGADGSASLTVQLPPGSAALVSLPLA